MWKTLRAITVLGALGLLATTGVTFAPRTAYAASAPSFTSTETRITNSPYDQYDPAISGNLITYTDLRGSDADIYYYNLASGNEIQVTNAAGNQVLSDVSGSLIVFSDVGAGSVVLYNTSNGVSSYLSPNLVSVSTNPAISGQTVVWQDNRDGNWEIYGQDLATGELRRISNDPDFDVYADISGNTVVWQRCSVPGQCQIMAYDWTSGVTRQLTDMATGDAEQPSVSGDRVVYQVNRNDEQDICAFDLSASTNPETCLSRPGPQINPNISGDYVAFEDSSSGTSHIMLWDVAHNAVFDVTGADPGAQYLNDIDGNRIVYTDNRNGQLDIYMSTFTITYPPSDTTAPTIAITTPADGATYLYGATVNAAYTCEDTESGVASCAGPVANGQSIDTSTVGQHTFTVNATDNAGNKGSASVTYGVRYDWVAPGILQPINSDRSSSFKLGSTIPVKFQLTGASAAVVDPAVRLYVTRVSSQLEGTVPEDGVSVPADSGFVFRYDSVAQQYIFNLSTKGADSNGQQFTSGTYLLEVYVGGAKGDSGVKQGEATVTLR